MTYTLFPVRRFGGVRLDAEPEEVGHEAAITLRDVVLSRHRDRLKTRPGLTEVVAPAGMTVAGGLASFAKTDGTRQLVVGLTDGANRYRAYTPAGTLVATQAVGTANISGAVRFGTPSAEYLYIANGVDTVWRWTGSAFSQPAGMPTALYLAKTLDSNRLVAGFTGGGGSRVQFSNAGAPETWSAGNFLDLAPGDGSGITGLANWQEMVFAFKRNRHFIFHGESTDTTGNPIFNFRPVDGFGAAIPPVAGREGVYFFDGNAVWVTQGGQPRRISEAIDPFFRGEAQIDAIGIDLAAVNIARMAYVGDKLYLSVWVGASGWRVLVYDPQVGEWTFWTTQAWRMVGLESGMTQLEQVYMLRSTDLCLLDSAATTDGGTAITWRYQSGWYDVGYSFVETTLRGMFVRGIGTPTVEVRKDYGTIDLLAAAVTLGTSPITAEGLHAASYRGTLFSHRLSGNTTATVSSLCLRVVGPRAEGMRSG